MHSSKAGLRGGHAQLFFWSSELEFASQNLHLWNAVAPESQSIRYRSSKTELQQLFGQPTTDRHASRPGEYIRGSDPSVHYRSPHNPTQELEDTIESGKARVWIEVRLQCNSASSCELSGGGWHSSVLFLRHEKSGCINAGQALVDFSEAHHQNMYGAVLLVAFTLCFLLSVLPGLRLPRPTFKRLPGASQCFLARNPELSYACTRHFRDNSGMP